MPCGVGWHCARPAQGGAATTAAEADAALSPPSRFIEFTQVAEQSGDGGDALDAALRAVLREAAVVEQQAERLAAVVDANRREQETYGQKQRQLEQAIEQVRSQWLGGWFSWVGGRPSRQH